MKKLTEFKTRPLIDQFILDFVEQIDYDRYKELLCQLEDGDEESIEIMSDLRTLCCEWIATLIKSATIQIDEDCDCELEERDEQCY